MTLSVPQDDFDQIAQWHFAVGGLDTQQEVLELAGAIRLRRLKAFPTAEQLAASLRSLPIAGAMAEHGADIIRHELVIDASRFEGDTAWLIKTAGAVLAGLRIRTGAEIICPAVCERSWASLESISPSPCRAFHFERAQSQGGEIEAKLVLPDDLDWVRENLGKIVELLDDERFETAIEAVCTYILAATDRMKVAQLWAGIDAVFGVKYELQFRISTLAARFLCEPGQKCRALYNETKKLYSERSKIIHGDNLDKKRSAHEEKVRQHIARTRMLLAQMLTKLIALGKVPTEDEFEQMLFEK